LHSTLDIENAHPTHDRRGRIVCASRNSREHSLRVRVCRSARHTAHKTSAHDSRHAHAVETHNGTCPPTPTRNPQHMRPSPHIRHTRSWQCRDNDGSIELCIAVCSTSQEAERQEGGERRRARCLMIPPADTRRAPHPSLGCECMEGSGSHGRSRLRLSACSPPPALLAAAGRTPPLPRARRARRCQRPCASTPTCTCRCTSTCRGSSRRRWW